MPNLLAPEGRDVENDHTDGDEHSQNRVYPLDHFLIFFVEHGGYLLIGLVQY